MCLRGDPVRLLIVPGLNDSGPAHWQTWLEGQYARRASRVRQDDWTQPDLPRWSRRIEETAAQHPRSRWVAVAHSFGCLALLHHLSQAGGAESAAAGEGVLGALLVAPAEPGKFGVSTLLPHSRLGVPSVLLASENDPWMGFESACVWARVWGSRLISLGEAGHINTESGFGPLPQAKTLVEAMVHRLERGRRIDRAHPLELSFAI